MTESIESFREKARAWLTENMPKTPAPIDGPASREFALAWQRTQARGGWAGLSWPAEHGGRGASVLQQIAWFEECVRAGAPVAIDPTFVGINHAGPTLIACGTDAHKAFHLPKIIQGEAIWCQGFSEPGSGSDLGSLKARGVVDGDFLVVDGQKIWSSYADIADYQELLVRTDPTAKTSRAITWVICPMDLPGITVRPIRTMAGAYKFCEVFYDNVRIPLANVVGGVNNGWATAMSTLSFERGTSSLGLLLALLQKVEGLLAICPADRPTMRARFAQLRAEGAGVRAMAYRLALDSAESTPDAVGSMVRLAFAEYAQRVTAAAIDLLGLDAAEVVGMHGLGHEYLDAFSETIAGGTSEIQRNIIGERLLGLPRGPR